MSRVTVEEFTTLQKRLADLRGGIGRAEAEAEQAQRAANEAAATLAELGFDLDGDLEEQLSNLRDRAAEAVEGLEEALGDD